MYKVLLWHNSPSGPLILFSNSFDILDNLLFNANDSVGTILLTEKKENIRYCYGIFLLFQFLITKINPKAIISVLLKINIFSSLVRYNIPV